MMERGVSPFTTFGEGVLPPVFSFWMPSRPELSWFISEAPILLCLWGNLQTGVNSHYLSVFIFNFHS